MTEEQTTYAAPRSRRKSTVETVLQVIHTPDRDLLGHVQTLGPAVTLIGRGTGDNHLKIAGDRSLSRNHAAVVYEADSRRFAVEDQGSRNGTYVNGRRAEREHLSIGDLIRLGETVIAVTRRAAPRPEVTPAGNRAIVAVSAAMRGVLAQCERVGPSDLHVLVTGETGVGKELVAHHIHASSRSSGPLIAVNCATLRPELAASELFGHVKGSFSGADRDHRGLLETAAGGTLFLDEVGELLPDIQAQLLRAIEEHEIRRVGGTHATHVDLRVVAATNVVLGEAADGGEFRSDLYARLAQWTVHVPPLRERREDVPALARHLLARFAPREEFDLTADAMEALCLHEWPRNVRELSSLVRRVTVELPEGGEVDMDLLPPEILVTLGPRAGDEEPEPVPGLPSPPAGQAPTRTELEILLTHYGGKVTEVARHLGRHRVQVHRWLKRHDLKAADFRK